MKTKSNTQRAEPGATRFNQGSAERRGLASSHKKIPLFVINLDRRQDRLSKMAEAAESGSFELHRVRAIDGRSATFTHSGDYVSTTEDACWRSHQLAYSAFLNTGAAYAVILEDDADLSSSALSKGDLESIFQIMEGCQINLLQIGHLHRQYSWWKIGPLAESIRDHIHGRYSKRISLESLKVQIVHQSFRSGAHAYAIDRKIASALVQLNSPTVFTADNFLGLLAGHGPKHLHISRLRKSYISQWARKTLRIRDLDTDIAPR